MILTAFRVRTPRAGESLIYFNASVWPSWDIDKQGSRVYGGLVFVKKKGFKSVQGGILKKVEIVEIERF